MAETTAIAWTDSTFNPWTGCQAVSPGCDNCYAAAWAKRCGRDFAVRKRTAAANWREPLKWNRKAAESGKPWRVFCASLADVLDNEVPDWWRSDLFNLTVETPDLTWLLLTKRIGNAAKMVPWARAGRMPWENIWLGATIVNQQEADRDIPKLIATPAAVRWLSLEPLLGPVTLHPWLVTQVSTQDLSTTPPLDWVVVGGESGGKRRELDMDAARSVIRQCRGAGVPVFVKQDSGPRPGMQGRFTDEEWALKQFPSNAVGHNTHRRSK